MKRVFSMIGICFLLAFTISSCGKDPNDTTTPGDGSCVVIHSPSYFGTTETLEYDSKRQLVKQSYEFNAAGYSTFVNTISAAQTSESYTHNGTLLKTTYVFGGGTGNLYDGMPDYMDQLTYQKNADGTELNIAQNKYLVFEYDAKKRLTGITKPEVLVSSNVADYYVRHYIGTTLQLTYDDSDNVTQLNQSDIFQSGKYIVNDPSNSYFVFDSTLTTKINVTYDKNPSPFSASLKYWKFVQNDWGLAINSNWQAIITALSKNNPLTINYKVRQGNATDMTNTMTYNYNENGLPADNYTYNCK
ncbi:MAG: hypothetical protein QM802_05225 [Agriterribacter sp.]